MSTSPDPSLLDLPVHDAIGDWSAAALTDALTAEERRLFEDHLAGCPRCRAQFAEDTAMSHTLQDVFVAAGPLPGFERRLTAAFRRRRGAGLAGWLWPLALRWVQHPAGRVALATAGTVALVALGGGLTHEFSLRAGDSRVPRIDMTMKDQVSQRLVSSKKAPVPAAAPVASGPAANERALAETRESSIAMRAGQSSGAAGDRGWNGGFAAGGAIQDYFDRSDHSLTLDGQSSGQGGSGGLPSLSPVTAPAESSGGAALPAPAAAPRENRKLVRNASLELEVAAFDPAVDALGAAASQAGGGYVATVNSSRQANGKRSGVIVIKVQPDQLDAFLSRLRDLGEVKGQTVSAEDVTKEYFDTDARLRNARRMEDRLLKILDEAKGKLMEILQVEKELGRVREDIEKMQGELQLYDSLVRFATVNVNLHEKDLLQPASFLLRRTAELTLLAPDVEKTYAEARRVAEEAHAGIASSNLVRGPEGQVTADLRLLLAPETADGALSQIKALARVQSFSAHDERTAQNGNPAEATSAADPAKVERGPVTLNLTISLADEEPASQQTNLAVLCAGVDRRQEEARQLAAAAGAQVRSSTFEQGDDGRQVAMLVFRLPLRAYPEFLARLETLGEAKEFEVRRNDRPAGSRGNMLANGDEAPAEISLRLYNQGRLVSDASGLGATIRRTLTQGAEALTWSLRMIGVALAFLAPWIAATLAVAWLVRLVARRRRIRIADPANEDP